ncbi:MAG: dihydroorotate dehydrogenase [Candidatus Buchananbacteria bacterium]|nr:dihydroorotate dehydrogenase [Candidatus Buchananbacteria bacterium]
MNLLNISIGKLALQNPIMPASGTFGFGEEVAAFAGMDLSRLGAMVGKTATLEPRDGNPQPRICECEGGMVNSIGLEGKGIDYILEYNVPFMASFGVPIIFNISGFSLNDFALLAQKANSVKAISAIEGNISCPNVEGGKIPFGSTAKAASEVTTVICEVTDLPVIIKLTPNVEPKSMIGEIASAVEEAGADAISMINTVKRQNIGGIPFCGLSGPPIKPIALELIKIVLEQISIPVIGMGGISCLEDVLEFLQLGCSAVAIGTANFSNPLIMMEIINGLEKYCQDNQIYDLTQLRGIVE